jgi:hypothetical protein
MATEPKYTETGDIDYNTFGLDGSSNYSEDPIPVPTETEYYDYGYDGSYEYDSPKTGTTESTKKPKLG